MLTPDIQTQSIDWIGTCTNSNGGLPSGTVAMGDIPFTFEMLPLKPLYRDFSDSHV